MIQLVRHQFSRKRDSCFSGGLLGEKDQDASEDADLFEIIREISWMSSVFQNLSQLLKYT